MKYSPIQINEEIVKSYQRYFDNAFWLNNEKIMDERRKLISDTQSFTNSVLMEPVFGYKNSNGTFKIGMRMWLDQGDYVKYVPYDNNYSINQHFMELIHKFQYEYPNLC